MNSGLHPFANHIPSPRLTLPLVILCYSIQIDAQFQYQQSESIGLGGANTGLSPYTKLIEGPTGALFGTTRFQGSPANGGTLFTVNKDGSGFRVLHVFYVRPGDGGIPTYAALAVGTNGLLYGVTDAGGTEGFGTIYSIRPDGSDYRTIYSFTANTGARPRGQLIIGDDGALVGTTWATTIFRIEHDGSQFRTLNSGTTNGPGSGVAYQAGVIKGSDGWLYGTSEAGGTLNPVTEFNDPWATMGTVFRVRQDGGDYEILHQFQGALFGDGAFPHGALIESSDGLLYGMTRKGGVYGLPPFNADLSFGTIFRLNRDGSEYQVIHRFQDGTGTGGSPYHELVENSDGALYGISSRGVFRIERQSGSISMVDTNENESAISIAPGLMQASDGRLYRATALGVIGVNPDGTDRQILCRFQNFPNERIPRSPLLASHGKLFGTTEFGGTSSNGAVFVLNPDATKIQVITMFGSHAASGKIPNGLASTNGFLYGTTQGGGSNNAGLIYRIDANGGSYTNLHHFGTTGDGRGPRAALVSGADGYLYGCAYQGGMFGRGTVFRIREDGSSYSTLRHLGATTPDGQAVQATLTPGPDGALYGVANSGGASNRGTLFRITKDGTVYANLRHFTGGSDGSNPQTPILFGSDGYLYGATTSGGDGSGTIYRLRPDGGEYQVLYRLTVRARDGMQPRGPLIEMPRGVLWGCGIGGGAYNSGILFRAQMDGSDYRVMWHFGADARDGTVPMGGLTVTEAGWVVGTTSQGGDLGLGSVFRFDPAAIFLRIEVAGAIVFLNWNRAGGELESATHVMGDQTNWSPQPADLTIIGNETTAVLPLNSSYRIFRVKGSQ